MIVGFDPGTVAAVAVLDLKGKLVFSRSFRGGLAEAVSLLSTFKPSIVASDKRDALAVRKLAASFGAVAFFPERDLSVREKASLVRRYRLKSAHERDALAAALNAYRSHRRLIGRVLAKEREIFDKLVKDELANISQALEESPSEGARRRKRDFALEGRVKDLTRKLELAEHLLLEKKGELSDLREKLKCRRQVVRRIRSPIDAQQEREARERLEAELMESHARLGKIEAQLRKLKGATPREKEDISQRVIRMIREYKERFRK